MKIEGLTSGAEHAARILPTDASVDYNLSGLQTLYRF